MATHLIEGTEAPLFTGIDQDGNNVSLKSYRGKNLIIFFYPEDDTPTCTIEACNLKDNFSLLKAKGFEVIGISPDDIQSHKKFELKFSLPFRIIADTEHTIINQYGVWGQKKLYGREYMGLFRTTFVIDADGIIRKIFRRPKNKAHAEEIIRHWEHPQNQ